GVSSVYQVEFTSGPSTVTLTLASEPSGLQLTLDGLSVTTPHAFPSVVGTTHTLGAPTSQRLNKTNYSFVNWSDGGAQTHNLITPSADTTYTAVYRKKGQR